ncbi:hypothetical protein ARMGADRAFT_1073826 [Armillaria gallica]|uniref:Uncharacterized protein n=1 Tax=Armillaria gallica TaxID=47427 RepID=A0A2H3DUJ3_ARMGA|nr:hypothetical protein ARMGADRAFT_1073826 [Armillaria gallica]
MLTDLYEATRPSRNSGSGFITARTFDGRTLYNGRMSLQAGFIKFYSWYDQSGFTHYVKIADLDRAVELALLHGIYTGIVSVALWNICVWNTLAVLSMYPRELFHAVISKSRSIGGVMVSIIILLYITTTINFFFNGPFLTASNDEDSTGATLDFWRYEIQEDALLVLVPSWGWTPRTDIVIGAAAVVSTVIADCTMIWRCWMVWGRHWLVVLVPILCLVSGIAYKIMEIMDAYLIVFETVSYLVFYLSCILATTLWCTILIVFRIVTVIRVNNGPNSGLGDYRHLIEVLVESSALHSVALIIYVALEVSYNPSSIYLDALAVFTTGIAPTLLVGRVAAGHARPDDSWQGSIISSLRFEAHPQADAETHPKISFMSDDDLEAQSSQVDKLEETGDEKRI